MSSMNAASTYRSAGQGSQVPNTQHSNQQHVYQQEPSTGLDATVILIAGAIIASLGVVFLGIPPVGGILLFVGTWLIFGGSVRGNRSQANWQPRQKPIETASRVKERQRQVPQPDPETEGLAGGQAQSNTKAQTPKEPPSELGRMNSEMQRLNISAVPLPTKRQWERFFQFDRSRSEGFDDSMKHLHRMEARYEKKGPFLSFTFQYVREGDQFETLVHLDRTHVKGAFKKRKIVWNHTRQNFEVLLLSQKPFTQINRQHGKEKSLEARKSELDRQIGWSYSSNRTAALKQQRDKVQKLLQQARRPRWVEVDQDKRAERRSLLRRSAISEADLLGSIQDIPGVLRYFGGHFIKTWNASGRYQGQVEERVEMRVEYCPETFGEWLRRGGVRTGSDVTRVLAAYAQTFEQLHRRCVFHLDIKANNLMFDSKGGTKVVDFGFGGDLSSPEALKSFVQRSIRRSDISDEHFAVFLERLWKPHQVKSSNSEFFRAAREQAGLEAGKLDVWMFGKMLERITAGQSDWQCPGLRFLAGQMQLPWRKRPTMTEVVTELRRMAPN